MKPSVLLIGDLVEEQWPSMDLVYEMLLRGFENDERLTVGGFRPRMRRRLSGDAAFHGRAYQADRFLNRFVDYPAQLRRSGGADVYHLVDHSYSQLLHSLPEGRTIVTCHDADTFRCLFDWQESRPYWFRWMTRRILSGLRRAALVTCDSDATREELIAHRIVSADKAIVVRLGVDPLFSAEANRIVDEQAAALLGEGTHILHVGSTVARKRIDVLLAVIAQLEAVRLVRVGGPLTEAQQELARSLGVEQRIAVLPFLDRALLAAVYRRADLLVLTSDREGFGFPIVEALASGIPVVASDLPVLRELAGDSALYARPGDAADFARMIRRALDRGRPGKPGPVRRWDEVAAEFAQLYLELASRSGI